MREAKRSTQLSPLRNSNSSSLRSSAQETNEEFKSKLKKLLYDPNITVTLLSLFCANAAISCLEATFGLYMDKQFGFTVEQIGMLYIIGAVPSVIGSKIAGDLGNKHGRWKVVWVGMVMQVRSREDEAQRGAKRRGCVALAPRIKNILD